MKQVQRRPLGGHHKTCQCREGLYSCCDPLLFSAWLTTHAECMLHPSLPAWVQELLRILVSINGTPPYGGRLRHCPPPVSFFAFPLACRADRGSQQPPPRQRAAVSCPQGWPFQKRASQVSGCAAASLNFCLAAGLPRHPPASSPPPQLSAANCCLPTWTLKEPAEVVGAGPVAFASSCSLSTTGLPQRRRAPFAPTRPSTAKGCQSERASKKHSAGVGCCVAVSRPVISFAVCLPADARRSQLSASRTHAQPSLPLSLRDDHWEGLSLCMAESSPLAVVAWPATLHLLWAGAPVPRNPLNKLSSALVPLHMLVRTYCPSAALPVGHHILHVLCAPLCAR